MSAINLEVFKGEKSLLKSTEQVQSASLTDLMNSIKTVKEKSNEFLSVLVEAEKTKQSQRIETEKVGQNGKYLILLSYHFISNGDLIR
jgi:hypothetical protein